MRRQPSGASSIAGPSSRASPTIHRRSIAAGRRRRAMLRAKHSRSRRRCPAAASSGCFRNREARGERCHHRLRLGQSALRRESVRARGAEHGRSANHLGHARSRDGLPRRSHRAARRWGLRRLPAGPGRARRHDRSVDRGGAGEGATVLRHLRRHAIDGDPRQGARHHRGFQLDRGRCRKDHAARGKSENSPHGLEYARRCAGTPGARAFAARAERPSRLFRALLSPQRCERGGRSGARRLWWPGHGDRRQGHGDRHAISPGKEPAFRAGSDFEFSEVEAVILFPAIDLKNGQCVRLEQGDMARATVFNLDPVAQACAFAAQGFEYLHVVDLDGAFAGKPMNAHAVEAMLKAVTMPLQLGGGIRDLKTVEAWLDKGVARVIIGTAAVRDPDLVKNAAKKFPGRVAVGLDARDGKVAVEGWAETSQVTALEIAQRFEDAGVAAIVFTDIARDGLLKGLNLDATTALAGRISIPVIASGGLASIEEGKAMLAPRVKELEGASAGCALYDGRLDPTAALTLIRNARAAA